MLKTSQAMGRARQGVGDASATRRSQVGDAFVMHQQRIGFLSATRWRATNRFGWDDVEDKL